MKVTCEIGVFDDDVGEECFAELAKLSPESMHPGEVYPFLLQTSADDPLVPRVLEVLQAHGMKLPPNPTLAGSPGFIALTYQREFEAADCAGADYLQITGSGATVLVRGLMLKRTGVGAAGTPPAPGGTYLIDTAELDRRRAVAARDQVVVLDEVKGLFERESFQGLEFRRGEPVSDPEGYCADGTFPIWELHTEVTLPPLSPECALLEFAHPENPGQLCRVVSDGLFAPPQLRYRAVDMRAIEPFDVARTRDGLNWGRCDHPLVVSQRFYQFCRKLKFEFGWIPVRIAAG